MKQARNVPGFASMGAAAMVILLQSMPVLVSAEGAGGAIPYGHPDFVSTPERPIGLHGDGNGHLPALAGKPEEQAKRRELYDIGRAVHFLNNPFRMAHNAKMARKGMIWHPAMSPEAPCVAQALELYRKLRKRVEALDPDPKILAALDEEIEYVETYRRGDIDALVEAGFLSRHGSDGKQIKGGKRAAVSAADPENSGAVGWAIHAKYRVPLKSLWWGWTPGAVSVPASDGRTISGRVVLEDRPMTWSLRLTRRRLGAFPGRDPAGFLRREDRQERPVVPQVEGVEHPLQPGAARQAHLHPHLRLAGLRGGEMT